MKKKVDFKVNKRHLLGKKVSQLRKQGLVVANLVSPGEESVSIQAQSSAFNKLYKEAGETNVVYLQIDDDKKEVPVLIDEVVRTPLSKNIDHVVFKKVDLSKKVEAEVPVELTGIFDVVGSTYLLVKDSILVSTLPSNIPEKFEIDLAKFTKAGEGVTVADLILPEGVELVLAEGENPQEVSVLVVQEEKEEVEEAPAVVEESAEAATQEGAEKTPEAGEKQEKAGSEGKNS